MCISMPVHIPVYTCMCVCLHMRYGAYQMDAVVKNPPASAGDVGDPASVPGSGRSPGEGNGRPPVGREQISAGGVFRLSHPTFVNKDCVTAGACAPEVPAWPRATLCGSRPRALPERRRPPRCAPAGSVGSAREERTRRGCRPGWEGRRGRGSGGPSSPECAVPAPASGTACTGSALATPVCLPGKSCGRRQAAVRGVAASDRLSEHHARTRMPYVYLYLCTHGCVCTYSSINTSRQWLVVVR